MKPVTQLEEARQRHAEAIEKMADWDTRIQALPEDAEDEEVTFLKEAFKKAEAESGRWAEQVERLEAMVEAKRALTPRTPDGEPAQPTEAGAAQQIRVGDEPLTYRKGGQFSFFGDLVHSRSDAAAAQRLARHDKEMQVELRADVTTDNGASGFVPPVYLADRWVDVARPGRPFADKVAKIPLEADGMTMSIPMVTSGAEVASQDGDGDNVASTDVDSDTLEAKVRTIAGQNDVSMQAFDRTRPGLDEVILRDLLRAYDSELDRQLLAGTGNNGQHIGIRAITTPDTPNDVDCDSIADQGAFLQKIYEGVSDIGTNAPGYQPNAIVMHPRRAAWAASFLGDKFPILQQGGLFQAAGTQDQGYAGTVAGLPVIVDANIATVYGASTNEDEVYVVALEELLLAEGPVRSRVLMEVLSDELKVRIQLYAYSAFFGGRRPKTIAVLSGDGLTAPTFGS